MFDKINTSKNPEEISYKEIEKIFNLTEDFFSKPELSISYIEKEAYDISNVLEEILGDNHKISLGVGYPFYVMNGDKKPIEVEEIKKFVKKNLELFKQNKNGSNELWKCPQCQEENNLTNLKTFCKECNLSILKPRILFKTLPDIDIITIVDKLDEDTENRIKEALKNKGYVASDTSIRQTIYNITNVLNNITTGKETSKKLPIDIHIIEKKAFLESLEKMKSGEKKSINVRSLRSSWEDNTLPIWFDLVFSATNLKKTDISLENKISETLETIKNNYGTDGLIEEIKKYSPRAKKILETPQILENMKHRISTWNNGSTKENKKEIKIEINSIDDLKQVLNRYNINYKSWGNLDNQATKKIEDLFKEIETKDCELFEKEGKIIRHTNVLALRVYYIDIKNNKRYLLKEKYQYFKEDERTRIRNKWSSLSEKLKINENPDEKAVIRAISEELGIKTNLDIKKISIKPEEDFNQNSSPSYPDLDSEYPIHCFEVNLTKEQFKKEYIEKEENLITYFSWIEDKNL